jgi:hypothetical protein
MREDIDAVWRKNIVSGRERVKEVAKTANTEGFGKV